MSSKHRTRCSSDGHRAHAPVFHECPACLFLSEDPAFAMGSAPCPACGRKSAARASFPAARIRRFDERIRRYHLEDEHEIVVILASTLLETLFEDVLARMMRVRGADTALIALVLDTERSVGMRLGKLFPALTGARFEQVAEDLGYPAFSRSWREMRSARNAFIHGESFGDPREALDARAACNAITLLDQGYDLFVDINNRFVADGGSRRRAR